MNREDLIILDQIRKVIKTNAKQNYETDMEETKDDGDTNSSISKQQASEESLNYKFNVFGQLQFLETAKQIIGYLSLSSNQTSESEEDEERKENLSISISE